MSGPWMRPWRSNIRKSQVVPGTQIRGLAGALECAEVSYRIVKILEAVWHVTGNDKDYLRKIPRVVW